MKKKLIVLISIASIFLTGCGSTKKHEEELDKLATDYYNTYMTGLQNISEVEITLEALKRVSEEKKYEFKKLKKCEDTTKVTYTLENEKIVDKSFEMFCK